MESEKVKEIKKALECHIRRQCVECPSRDVVTGCGQLIAEKALEAINRQKTELEQLKDKAQNLACKSILNMQERVNKAVVYTAEKYTMKLFAKLPTLLPDDCKFMDRLTKEIEEEIKGERK